MTNGPGPHPPLSVIIGGRSRASSRGGSGGGGNGYEGRVARLEASVSHLEKDMQEVRADIREIRTDIRDVRDRLTKLEVRVDHLPSKGFVVTSLVLSLAVIAALVTFQSNIQRLVGQAPGATSSAPPALR